MRPPAARRRLTRRQRHLGVLTAALAVLASSVAASPVAAALEPAQPDKIWSDLAADFAAAPGDTLDFWVALSARADNSEARQMNDWAARGTAVAANLRANAESSQAPVREVLDAAGASYDSYWIVNALHVEAGNRDLALRLSALPGVHAIFNGIRVEQDEPFEGSPEPKVGAVEWGIADINADDVWAEYGITGEGIVVANIDTGVDYDHPALVNQYRGNLGDGEFDNNYNWFDVFGSSEFPNDGQSHGTHTMGTIVGSDGGANQIGVAPGARWIASNAIAQSDFGLFLEAMEWMLEPRDLEGENPDASKRPNIISNSWGVAGVPTDPFGDEVQQAWIDSGIFGTWSNRNLGPSCGSTGSPGGRALSYSNGAYDINHVIASFSSRGPGEDGITKPNISGPGVNVRSSIPGGGYGELSGTSMSTPHLAGSVALLWSAAPALIGDIEQTRDILDESAVDVDATECGGTVDDNNVFGEGRLDVLAAMGLAPIGDSGRVQGTVTDGDTGDPVSGAKVEFVGEEMSRAVTTDANGGYLTSLPVGTYEVSVTKFGYVTHLDTVRVRKDRTLTHDVELEVAERFVLVGKVTDKGTGKGIPDATIVVGETGLGAETRLDGTFRIKSVPAGSYEMTAAAGCYRTSTKQVEVDGGRVDGTTESARERLKFALKAKKDGAGYSCRTEQAVYHAGSTVLELSGDEKVTTLELPFSFPYYGKRYDEIQVSTNGHARFVPLRDAAPDNMAIPSTEKPNGVLAAFWDDLVIKKGAEVRTERTGSRFTIEWRGARFYSAPGSVDVSLTLQSNGEVVVSYRGLKGELEQGLEATVGIEDHRGRNGVQYSSDTRSLDESVGVRFVPPAS